MNGACPDLESLIAQTLQNQKSGKYIELEEDMGFDDTNKPYRTQEKIEQRIFIDRCLSHESIWMERQYIEWIGSKKTGRRWGENIICKLWEVQWDTLQGRNMVRCDTPLAET